MLGRTDAGRRAQRARPVGSVAQDGDGRIRRGTVSWLGVCSGNGITLWLIFTWVYV
jgi:hypothetical protein